MATDGRPGMAGAVPVTTGSGPGARHVAVLRAVAAGRAELSVSRVPDVYVDGRCCTDHTVAGVLTAAGLIFAPRATAAPLGSRVPAQLTDKGAALLAAAGGELRSVRGAA
jgi:hypothetical protein